jgi:2-methylisocitrate lyase-like PEP mutase family enzyme
MDVSTFRRLHEGPEVLVLANCWDAGTARLIASLGARALATTSAGVAWSHGYPDGAAFPTSVLLATVREIRRVTELPLTVDAEAGYTDDPGAVADTIAALVDAGCVGVNLEDGPSPPEILVAKIARIKASLGAAVFVNARVDVYLRSLVPRADQLAETLVRAARYREAGADGIFVPGLAIPDEIRTIASQVGLPLNVLALRGLPAGRELAALGVRRLSAGSGITQAAWARIASLARGFLSDGASDPLSDEAMPYMTINPMFAAGSAP